MKKYDVIVLGGGIAGYSAAIRATQFNLSVCLIEKKYLGGTCLNYGCIPTKTILQSTKLLSSINKAAEFGINVSLVEPKIAKIIERKNKVVERLRQGVKFLLDKRKVDIYEGVGSLLDSQQVEVKLNSGDKLIIEGKNTILSTGSVNRELPNIVLDGNRIISSEQALQLSTIPKNILIIGGGVIGVEFATIFNELGVEVTILEIMPAILPMLDADIAKLFLRNLKKQKIKVITGISDLQVEPADLQVTFTLNDKVETIMPEMILSAAGRVPNLEGIDLKKLGIVCDGRYIKVNQYLQTSVDNIYAAGDLLKTPMLAHVALKEGITAVENIAGKQKVMNYLAVPNCIYTHPEISSCGLNEAQAIALDYEVGIGTFDLKALGRAQSLGETDGMVKLVMNKKDDTLLGAHIMGPSASEMISVLGLALENKIKVSAIKEYMFPHPTLAESIGEAALSLFGEEIHQL